MIRNALILSLAPHGTNARINRLIQTLEEDNWKVGELSFRGESVGVELSARRFLARTILFLLIAVKIEPWRAGYIAASTFLISRSGTETVRKFEGVLIVEDSLLLPLIQEAKPGTRVVVDIRDLSYRLFENRTVWRTTFGWSIGRMTSQLLPMADAVYTVSEGLADFLFRDFGVRAKVIRSIPDAEPREAKNRRKGGPLSIVYAGRADQNRRIDLLIAACNRLEKYVALDLYLVGHRPDIKRLEEKAKQMSHVQLRPPVPLNQLVERLSNYDLGYAAWPPNTHNLAASLPNKFFEYMLAGTPVIVSAGGEMARMVEHYSCGVLIDPADTARFSRTLQELASCSLSDLALGVRQAQQELTWYKERQGLLEVISGENL